MKKTILALTAIMALGTTSASASDYTDCTYIDNQLALSISNVNFVTEIADGEIGVVAKNLWSYADYLEGWKMATLNNSKICHDMSDEYTIKENPTPKQVSATVAKILRGGN